MRTIYRVIIDPYSVKIDCFFSSFEAAKECAESGMHGWAERFEGKGYPPIPDEIEWAKGEWETWEPVNVPQYMGRDERAGYACIREETLYDNRKEIFLV
jgi:hypothetical protein